MNKELAALVYAILSARDEVPFPLVKPKSPAPSGLKRFNTIPYKIG